MKQLEAYMINRPKYYRISGGRIWDVEAACFVTSAPQGAKVVQLYEGAKPADVSYLKKTLAFYGYDLGTELMTLEEAKAAKLAEINAACQSVLERLTLTYPERELLTFDKQEKQARDFLSGNKNDIGHITAIAQGRGITVDELAQKIVAKADAFSMASGLLIGRRQMYEDRLDAADTLEAVAAIAPEYTMSDVCA